MTSKVVTARRLVTLNSVGAALDEIVPRRFGGALQVRPQTPIFWVGHSEDYYVLVGLDIGDVRITSPRVCLFNTWLRVVLANELAVRLHASLREPGIAGAVRGKRNRHPHYRDFLMGEFRSGEPDPLNLTRTLVELELRRVPAPLRAL